MKPIRRALAALLTMTLLLSSIPLSTFAEPAYTEAPVQSLETIAADLEMFQQSAGNAVELPEAPADAAQSESFDATAAPDSNELPTTEPTPEVLEATVEPLEEIPDVAPAEPTSDATPEPTAEVTMEPTAEPTATPETAPTKKPVDKYAGKVGAMDSKVPFTSSKATIHTAQELAEYFDISLSELADWLEIDKDTLLAMPAEELQPFVNRSMTESGANATKISLGREFSNTANTAYACEYEIYISRSGRYRLSLYGSKYLAVNVYNGNTFVSNVNHACNGYSTNWTVDLEKGKTYTFAIMVDGNYSSGYCQFEAELNLYIDGSYKDRAGALAFDVYSSYDIKYSNDYQIFCFTALSGRKYRLSSTGAMVRSIEIYNGDFKPINNMLVKNISGGKYFDMNLTIGNTYYILVHGRDYFDDDAWWYTTGSGTLMIQCLDADTSPVTFSMDRTSVDPGLSSSVRFTVVSQYAKKVRLLMDGQIVSDEYKISGGKAEFSHSFHVSGTHNVQVQGYTNGGWSLMSRSQSLYVNWGSSLGKPVFESPANDSATTYANTDFPLRWRSLNGASQYMVKLYSGSENIYSIPNISGTSCTIPGDMLGTAGIYTIELYGLARSGQQSNPCARATLTVEPSDHLVKPTKVELSESGTVILGMDDTLQLHASVQPANAMRKLTWSSSSSSIATVDASGLVVPVKEGTVTITVKTDNGKKDTVKVQVVDPNKPTGVELTVSGTISMTLNDDLQLYANMLPASATRNLTWSSSNKKIATVDANGLVTPLAEGTVTITVKTHNGKKDTVKIKIADPNKPTGVALTVSGTVDLRMDRTLQLYANMQPASATRSLTWSSSNKKIATVDTNGLVTPLKAGTVTITVKTHNGKKDTVKIKIQEYYRVQGLQLLYNGSDYGEIYVGDTVALTVKYTPAKASTFANLTWKSDKPSIVSVSSDGKLTALNTGYALITATDSESRISASFGVVVTRQPRYRAIVVVENTYTTGARRLFYSRSTDRTGIKKMLAQQNFNGRKVEQIADLSNMSKTSLMSQLRSLPQQWNVHEDDVTYFFFAGHGSNNGYLCLYAGGAENQYISAYELKNALDAIPGKVVVVIGSCYSGYFIYDGYGSFSNDEPDPKAFTDAIIDVFSEGDTLPVVAVDESGAEITISHEDQETWEQMGVSPNTGELRQSKYYVLTAAAHNQQGWYYYRYRSNKIIESQSYGCFDRAVCYAGGRDSVGGKTTWKSGTRTLQQVYTTVQKKVNEYHKKNGYPSKKQSVQVYPPNSNFVIFSK